MTIVVTVAVPDQVEIAAQVVVQESGNVVETQVVAHNSSMDYTISGARSVIVTEIPQVTVEGG